MAKLSISDTGIGIPEEHFPVLFEPFQQVDNSYSRRFEGTGLGLALSQEFCKAMGGRIEVESVVEEGTTFSIILPMRQ